MNGIWNSIRNKKKPKSGTEFEIEAKTEFQTKHDTDNETKYETV
jgi:hypothetical protein